MVLSRENLFPDSQLRVSTQIKKVKLKPSYDAFILFKDSMRRTGRTLKFKSNPGQGRLSQSCHKLKSI